MPLFISHSILLVICLCLQGFVVISAQDSTGIKPNVPPDQQQKYIKTLGKALILQLRSDSMSRVARDRLIKAREAADEATKKQIMGSMYEASRESARLQQEADLKFAEARSMRGPVVPGTPASPGSMNPVHPGDEFILTGDPPYGPSNPIPEGLPATGGLVYRVQLGVFSKPMPDDAFGGISPVWLEHENGTPDFRYFAGLFRTLASASRAQQMIRKGGIPDAFIVPFLDGLPITMERAKELEFANLGL